MCLEQHRRLIRQLQHPCVILHLHVRAAAQKFQIGIAANDRIQTLQAVIRTFEIVVHEHQVHHEEIRGAVLAENFRRRAQGFLVRLVILAGGIERHQRLQADDEENALGFQLRRQAVADAQHFGRVASA